MKTRTGMIETHCAEDAIEIAGQRLVADKYTGYIEFWCSHAFPCLIDSQRVGFHPQVVANSYETLRHKVFNLAHIMAEYGPENLADRVFGGVVAVEFPATPEGGWKVQADPAKAPALRGVASIFKQAQDARSMLDQHLSGRRKWSVSQEIEFDDGGFIVGASEHANFAVARFEAGTPDDLRNLGYIYVPEEDAPPELLAGWDDRETGMLAAWRSRDIIFLGGGYRNGEWGKGQYKGVGATTMPKEKTAKLGTVLASHELPSFEDLLAGLHRGAAAAAAAIRGE